MTEGDLLIKEVNRDFRDLVDVEGVLESQLIQLDYKQRVTLIAREE